MTTEQSIASIPELLRYGYNRGISDIMVKPDGVTLLVVDSQGRMSFPILEAVEDPDGLIDELAALIPELAPEVKKSREPLDLLIEVPGEESEKPIRSRLLFEDGVLHGRRRNINFRLLDLRSAGFIDAQTTMTRAVGSGSSDKQLVRLLRGGFDG